MRDHIGDVLDDVSSLKAIERIVGKRIGEVVQVAEDIGGARRIAVDADRPGSLLDSAANVEYPHSRYLNRIHRRGAEGAENFKNNLIWFFSVSSASLR